LGLASPNHEYVNEYIPVQILNLIQTFVGILKLTYLREVELDRGQNSSEAPLTVQFYFNVFNCKLMNLVYPTHLDRTTVYVEYSESKSQ
jgi:hypothetical protein